MIWTILCTIAIVYTILDVAVSIYIVHRIGIEETRARLRSFFIEEQTYCDRCKQFSKGAICPNCE
jgi:hypothetical protein